MSLSKQIILKFTEDSISLSIVKRFGRTVKILKNKAFNITEGTNEDGELLYFDSESDGLSKFIQSEKLSGRKVNITISQEGIITRQVQSPKLSKSDLDKFIKNNIGEYFTLNIGEYEYDYIILGEEKQEVLKFNILLVLFPKNKLKAITEFTESKGLLADTISIYPVGIENIFNADKDKSIAVFDIEKDRTSITILEKGTIFLYSRINSEFDEKHGDYDELMDSLLYFLNFYSTRHYGNKVDSIYILGNIWNNYEFYEQLKEQTDIKITAGINLRNITIETGSGIDKNLLADVIGSVFEFKRKYSKSINFKAQVKAQNKKKDNRFIAAVSIALAACTFLWIIGFTAYKAIKIKDYDTAELYEKKSSFTAVNEEYNKLQAQETELKEKKKMTELINGMDTDFTPYVEILRKALPADTKIRSFQVDIQGIKINFVINGAINKVTLVEQINSIGVFEKININSVRLDDSEKEAQFELKIVKPLKEEKNG